MFLFTRGYASLSKLVLDPPTHPSSSFRCRSTWWHPSATVPAPPSATAPDPRQWLRWCRGVVNFRWNSPNHLLVGFLATMSWKKTLGRNKNFIYWGWNIYKWNNPTSRWVWTQSQKMNLNSTTGVSQLQHRNRPKNTSCTVIIGYSASHLHNFNQNILTCRRNLNTDESYLGHRGH